MLTGKELGRAIQRAIEIKFDGIRGGKKALAEHMGVKQPSIQDWVNRGTIGKERLPALWEFFRGSVGPEHWGLQSFPDLPSSGPSRTPLSPPPHQAASSLWPFTVSRAEFDELPQTEHVRIDAYIQGVYDQWTAHHRKSKTGS